MEERVPFRAAIVFNITSFIQLFQSLSSLANSTRAHHFSLYYDYSVDFLAYPYPDFRVQRQGEEFFNAVVSERMADES